jgi:hypothetical protein
MNSSLKTQLAAGILFAASCQLSASPSLAVRFYSTSSASVRDVEEMKQDASQVLKHSGVEIEWVPCAPSPRDEVVVCTEHRAPAGLTVVIVRLVDKAPQVTRELDKKVRPLIGWADLDSFGIIILYQTACTMAQNEPRAASKGQILGHAVAHEIGHLLFGSRDHSAAGIMKANYSRDDLYAIARGDLLFTEEESRLLRARVSSVSALAEP